MRSQLLTPLRNPDYPDDHARGADADDEEELTPLERRCGRLQSLSTVLPAVFTLGYLAG